MKHKDIIADNCDKSIFVDFSDFSAIFDSRKRFKIIDKIRKEYL